ncbi:MAG: PspC domain-containing protein [Actinobacteria bacterium]|nr:PspC domain-containing protein [Actinomycetota bacterium]
MVDVETEERTVPPPPRRPGGQRLVRRTSQGVIAGVAAGVAERVAVDVLWVRLAFVVSIFFGGFGLFAYAALWLLAPDETTGRSVFDDLFTDRDRVTTWIGVGVIAIALVMLANRVLGALFGPVWFADAALDRFGFPIALIAIGAAVLWFGQRNRGEAAPDQQARSRADAAATDELPHVAASEQPTGTADPVPGTTAPTGSTAPTEPASPTEPTVPTEPGPSSVAVPAPAATPPGSTVTSRPVLRRPRPRRQRSILGRVTVAITFLVVGTTALLDQLEVIEFHAAHYLALALLVVGSGLVVGAWRGRARGLILLGALLVPPLIVASAVQGLPVDVADGMGQRFVVVASADDLVSRYKLFAGELTLDLSQVALTEGQHELDAAVGFGQLHVIVPPDVAVEAISEVRGGELNVLGRSRAGWRTQLRVSDAGTSGVLVMNLEVGFGRVHVIRAAPEV